MVDNATTSPRAAPRKRRLALAFGLVGLVLLIVIAGTASWLSSEAALRYLLDYAVARSEGKIEIEEASGSLLGTVRLKRVGYRDGETRVVLDDVAIDYQPRRLLGGRLVVNELTAQHARVEVAGTDDTPVAIPDSIVLPLDLTIERLHIARLDWQIRAKSGVLERVALAYSGDRSAHRVRDLDVTAPGVHLTGSTEIATSRPFATQGVVALVLSKPHPEGRIDAKLGGNLEALVVEAKSTVMDLAAEISARLAPFAKVPFVEGRLEARAVDLKRLDASWPTTRLDLTIEAMPTAQGFSGQAQFTNQLAGPLDAGKLPIERARSAFSYASETFAFERLAAQVAGGATVEGGGSVDLDGARSRWKLAVKALDLAKLHTALRPTALNGRVDADVTGRAQRIVADLAQKDLRVAVEALYQDDTLVAERLVAEIPGGTLEGKGRIVLAGARPFEVNLTARRFDPARFGDFPRGTLDGTLIAKGTSSPTLATDLDLVVAPGSRLAGVGARGRVRGSFTPTTARGLDADLTLGANRLQAKGAIGRTQDTLELNLDARRLAELAPLWPAIVPKPLTGSLAGTATFETRARGGALAVDLRARDLVAASDWRFATLAVVGRATHDAPLAKLRIDALREIELEVEATRAVTPAGSAARARGELAGSPTAHRLRLVATEGASSLDASLAGALASQPLAWRGRIEALTVRGMPGISEASLVSPASLEVSDRRLVLGAARIEGGGALLDVERVDWRDGALETRGRFRSLPLAPLLKEAELAARFPTDLVVGGAWDVRSQPDWRGTLAIARERGDVYVDEPTVEGASKIALGLEALALNATLDGRRLSGHAEMRARLGGDARADFELIAPANGNPFSRDAALRGTASAKLASLAPLQPWVGTSIRLQGTVSADLRLAGTLGAPTFAGELIGHNLRADMPQYGVSYKDGELKVVSGPEGLRVETLSFVAGDGRFTASGLIGLPREGGFAATSSRLAWRAENFRVTNRPDLRLVVDGTGTLGFEAKRLVLRGKLSADEGNIEYRSSEETTLADDIVVVGRPRPGGARSDPAFANVPLDLDLELELGRNLRFAAEGLDTRLAGHVQITSKGGAPIVANGTIRTVRGTYWAFGQRLDIERGRIVFGGPLANPSLDIVALRKNLAVEAGVEITGTVRAPLVRLTSNPPVPDNEKLAWLLTGGPPGSGSARDTAAIQAAAATLFGQGGKPFSQTVAQKFGLDDISVAQRNTLSADSVSGQVVTLGKRLSDRLYVAYEQGLTIASNALRIEYVLSRFLTVSAFAGTQSGVALNFRRVWR